MQAANQNKIESRHYLFFILVIGMEYLRPQDFLVPQLGSIKLSMLLTSVLIFFALRARNKVVVDTQIKIFFAIVLLSIAWVPFARNNFYAYSAVKNLLLFFFSILLSSKILLQDFSVIKKFVFHWIVIMAILAGIVISRGGIGPGSFLWDENDVCIVLVAAIPFAMWAAQYAAKTKSQRWLCWVMAVVLVLAAAYTRSRGGFLALAVCLLVIWWYSKSRMKAAAIALACSLVFGGVILALLPKGYFQEMETMTNPEDSTAIDRLKHWSTAWEMYKDNFVFGVGPGNYPWHHSDYIQRTKYYDPNKRSGQGRQVHSLYFTVLPELGTVGTIAFFSMVFVGFSRLRSIRKGIKKMHQTEEVEAVGKLAEATISALAGFLIGAAFISVLWYPSTWQWLMFYWAAEIAYQNLLNKKEQSADYVAVKPKNRLMTISRA